MKKASSMIELVVSIVVIGIAVMTLPLMLEQTQRNSTFTMQQEAILVARTKLGNILTYSWDDNTVQNNIIGVLDVHVDADDELDRNTTQRRVGHVSQDRRRKFFTNSTFATTHVNLGSDGSINDIDDFIEFNSYNLSGNLDYRFKFDINTTVNYHNDTANYSAQDMSNFTFSRVLNTTSTNIKRVRVSLYLNDINTTLMLEAYSANIGGTALLRRVY
ncbi:MAG: type II secretion system protein [Sulfurospirillum sp.]|nr:type II secretion system protein [Sulfurospirillum sp.]MBL0703124.1 type II secretion system protein [Sulfurospirillum sp.]